MANYDQDIKEIIGCLVSVYKEAADDYASCLECLAAPSSEKFLSDRADALRSAANYDRELVSALQRLSSHCKGISSVCNDCIVRKYCNTYIEYCRNNASTASLQMVDLFCGAGGLSLGFTQEGFTTALANDIEPCCVDTYAHNHPETPRDHIVLGDIREVVDHLEELLKGKQIDIVVGGPPCQGFSMANRQRLIDDPRNHLYKNYVEVVKRVRPRFFVMENVKGMLSVADQVKEDFRSIGYSVECHVLNAKDFGVPQNRERLIYIGNRVGADNNAIFEEIFALATTLPNHVLADALYALRPLQASRVKNSTEQGSAESGYIIEGNGTQTTNEYIDYINQGRIIPVVFNHKARYNNDRDIEIFGRLYQGDKSDDPKIADIMPYARRNDIFKDKYFKLEEQKVCKTITAHMKFDCNMYIHPTQARGLTPREAARVQSYPDDYFFRGAYTKTYMQIGNSVPPLLGRAIAHVVKKYLESEVL
ncbi:DNA cytosine methyltransferase [Faecalicatena contorta]|uniref:DNA cytosine methyltransferase n=1 Tax=Faecalicatena contorta TaxID=39482 RepID=UPI001F2F158A|nr:DNA cytosine methyltransferase [Faecalicatena contorta]MCF2554986.1 DNA cytosine methyltransferase [Faecalicatena contorta]